MEDRNTIVGKPGPFEIIEGLGAAQSDLPGEAPRRRYDCNNYDVCLELAAALNWDSFTCRGCNEEVSQPLLWRAHQARRKDSVAGSLCDRLPEIHILSNPCLPERSSEAPQSPDCILENQIPVEPPLVSNATDREA